MKSSKVISIVLLVGMASQAHGMFGSRLGRLGSKAFTTRGLVAATAAAATTAGLGRYAYAEGNKQQQGYLRVGKERAFVGSWLNPWTWNDYRDVNTLQLVEKDKITKVPCYWDFDDNYLNFDGVGKLWLSTPYPIDPVLLSKIQAVHKPYQKAAEAMVAKVNRREKRSYAQGKSIENIFEKTFESINVSGPDPRFAKGFDPKILKPFFYDHLKHKSLLYDDVAREVDKAIWFDRLVAALRKGAERQQRQKDEEDVAK